jgi:hypothetical protein
VEVILGRVINPESAGKERKQLCRAIVVAIRELMQQTEINEHTHDLAAFIILALDEIAQSVDLSVAPWEKRGYWIKADRFRMEWAWSSRLAVSLREALLGENWPVVAELTAQVAQKLNRVDIPKRYKFDELWDGAWDKFMNKKVH